MRASSSARESLGRSGGGAGSIQEECDRIGGGAIGEAVVTGTGNLPARWVIHAVGPRWHGGEQGEEMALASAMLAALSRAEEIGARSVAIPAISTGVFEFPVERAAEISVAMAKSFARTARNVQRILFCLSDTRTLEIFRKEVERSG